MDAQALILVFLAFAVGGILKGATGAGAPILAVPLLVILYDVPFAVAVFQLPNLVPNMVQAWRFRADRLDGRFLVALCFAGGLGAGVGTVALAGLSSRFLMLGVAIAVFLYVGFRFLNPAWRLDRKLAGRVVSPVAFFAGVLQGGSGISAPISVAFLNTMKLERPQFISTISVFFVAMAVIQIPVQASFGILTAERLFYSLLALVPLMIFMPVGAFLGRRMTPKLFDMIILSLLTILAVKLVYDALN